MSALPQAIEKSPLLYIIPFFSVGIATAYYSKQTISVYEGAIWGICIFLTSLMLLAQVLRKRIANGILFSIILFCFFFVLGVAITLHKTSRAGYNWSEQRLVYQGLVIDKPTRRGNVTTCNVFITEAVSAQSKQRIRKTIKLSVFSKSDSLSPALAQVVTFYGKISTPRNNGNPKEFDFASFLLRENISGTAFLYSSDLKIMNGGNEERISNEIPFLSTLKTKALEVREKMLESIQQTSLEKESVSLLAAITLGDKSFLKEETRNQFAAAGVSHVLALSGLHLGIIYAILHFLFYRRSRRRSLCVEIFTILFLWAFVFITGMSVSITRSALMLSIMSVSVIAGSRGNSLNNLAFAAIIMLFFNPLVLFDVGFQLSFASILFILLLNPFFQKYAPSNRILSYIYSLLTVSLCAQAGVAPLIAYYFHSLPVLFLLTNLVVIPITSVLLGISVAFFALFWIPAFKLALSLSMSVTIDTLCLIVKTVAVMPFSSISVYPSLPTVFLCYAISFFILLYSYNRRTVALKIAMLCFTAITCLEIYAHRGNRLSPQIVFYNNRSCPAVHFIESEKVNYIWLKDTASLNDKMEHIAKAFWKEENIEPKILKPRMNKDNILFDNGIVLFGRKKVAIISDDSWSRIKPKRPLCIDILYICKGAYVPLDHLPLLFSPRLTVIDATLAPRQKEGLKKECRKLKWKYHDIEENGALISVS